MRWLVLKRVDNTIKEDLDVNENVGWIFVVTLAVELWGLENFVLIDKLEKEQELFLTGE